MTTHLPVRLEKVEKPRFVKPKTIRVSQLEARVLACLLEDSRATGEMCLHFATIEYRTDLERKIVRRACRSLARKGLAEFFKGLCTDDGEFAGAGYCVAPQTSTVRVSK
jgi:hypothetical protein